MRTWAYEDGDANQNSATLSAIPAGVHPDNGDGARGHARPGPVGPRPLPCVVDLFVKRTKRRHLIAVVAGCALTDAMMFLMPV